MRQDQLIAMLARHVAENHTPHSEYDSSKFSLGDYGYRPYCCSCSTMKRMVIRDSAYHCDSCGNTGTTVNGKPGVFVDPAPQADQ